MLWSGEEVELLRTMYFDTPEKELLTMFPGRSFQSLKMRASLLDIKRLPRNGWTKQEVDFVNQNYGEMKPGDIASKIGKTADAVKLKAASIGLAYSSEQLGRNLRKCDLSFLAQQHNLEALYWIGFILADGHITKDLRLQIKLSSKDEAHLQKLADRLSCKITKERPGTVGISPKDTSSVKKIQEIYGVWERKTYNPPDIASWNLSDEEFLAMFIGFIDGDGNIGHPTGRTDAHIRIKCHANWLRNLQFFSDVLHRTSGLLQIDAKVNNAGYSSWIITNSQTIKWLKIFAIENRLPTMERKWNLIDLTQIGKIEQARINEQKVFKMYSEGKRQTDIANETGLSNSGVCQILKRGKKKERCYDVQCVFHIGPLTPLLSSEYYSALQSSFYDRKGTSRG